MREFHKEDGMYATADEFRQVNPDEYRCWSCAFFDPIEPPTKNVRVDGEIRGIDYTGYCRRHSPRPVITEYNSSLHQNGNQAIWPEVDGIRDWCGNFSKASTIPEEHCLEPESEEEELPFRPCELCGAAMPPDYNYARCEECGNKPCRHGNPPGECNECMIVSDREYDEYRERL